MIKRIVCLANSRKNREHCIAGKEYENGKVGGWVRPVSSRPSKAINDSERRAANGTYCGLLDIIDIPLLRPVPLGHQRENYQIDAEKKWKRVGAVPFAEIPNFVDDVKPLWTVGNSSYNGWNDRLSLDDAASQSDSLRLIGPCDIFIRRQLEGTGQSQKYKVRAEFNYGSTSYMLVVTDISAELRCRQLGQGVHEIKNAYLCVSLGDKFDSFCYKLVATIFAEELGLNRKS